MFINTPPEPRKFSKSPAYPRAVGCYSVHIGRAWPKRRKMKRMKFFQRAVLLLLPGLLLPAWADTGPALFSFSPIVVSPGGTLTVWGARFSPASPAVSILLVNAAGQATRLGIGILSGGAFQSTVTIPSTSAPGRYYINVADSPSRIALNLTGSPIVAPSDAPWFQFTPSIAAPRGSVTFSGAGFDPGGGVAGIAVLDKNRKATVLGFAGLSGGAFHTQLTLPPTLLPSNTFQVFVKDAGPRFAANLSGTLTVVNSTAGPAIPVGLYPIGAAVNPGTNRIYVPIAGDDTVAVLDGDSNSVLTTVPVGQLPCAVGANPNTGLVYIANVNSNSLSVLDGATNTIVASVPVGAFPCAVAVMPQTNRIYVGNSGGNDVSVIDGVTNTVIASIPVGLGPWGLGVNPNTNRIYAAIVYANTVAVIDGSTNTVVASIPTGGVNPDAIGVNPASNRIYAANYFSDTVSVIDGAANQVTAVVPVGRQPSGVSANPVTGNVYTSNYGANTVTVFNANNVVIKTLAVGRSPNGLAVNPVTGKFYELNSLSSSVSVIQDQP